MEIIKGEIIESARYYEAFLEIKRKLEKEIEFRQVLHGMGREGAIGYVTGYIPYDHEGYLLAEARRRGQKQEMGDHDHGSFRGR